MAAEASPERGVEFQFHVSPEEEGGRYANFLAVWHTPHEFTLDFASILPSQVAEPDDEEPQVQVPCRVVARVKIPVSVVFEVLQALNENMTNYERKFGEISRRQIPPEERAG